MCLKEAFLVVIHSIIVFLTVFFFVLDYYDVHILETFFDRYLWRVLIKFSQKTNDFDEIGTDFWKIFTSDNSTEQTYFLTI